MKQNTLFVVISLTLLLAGCAQYPRSDYPSTTATPVPPKRPPAKKPIARRTQPAPSVAKRASPGRDTATYAIDSGTNNFKVEPNLPAFRPEPLMAPPDLPPLSIQMEDAAIPSGTSPAVVALISESDRNRNSGDLDAAVIVMERALRIDSRNPTLTYKLAQLRLKQNKPQAAEELAGKAALLAGRDLDLKRKSWLLIAEARQIQQNYQGARDAKAKAESFFGR